MIYRDRLFLLAILVLVWARIGFARRSQGKLPDGATVKITGRVGRPAVESGGRQVVTVGEYRILINRDVSIRYGDLIRIIGKARDTRRGSEVVASTVDTLEPGKSGLKAQLFDFSRWATSQVKSYLPVPESGLLAGVLLGAKGEVDYDFYNQLRRTGTTHIVVASGTNVSMVGGLVLGLFVYAVGRKLASLLAIVAIWLFALMAGLDAPIVRAAIMGTIVMAGGIAGIGANGLRVLLATGAIMIIIKPLLIYDLGFQLSFMATLGLTASGGKRWRKIPGGMRETLAAQIFTLPVIAFNLGWGAVAWISPLVNLLVGVLVPPMMAAGALLVAVAGLNRLVPGLFGPLAVLVGWAAYIPAHLFVTIVGWWGR